MIIHWSDKHAKGPPEPSKPGTKQPDNELLIYTANPIYRTIKYGSVEIILQGYEDMSESSGNYAHGSVLNWGHNRASNGSTLVLTQT